MNAIKLSKGESKLARWLLKARADQKDPREVLRSLNRQAGSIHACDGVRLHATKAEHLPALSEAPDTFNPGKVNAGETILDPVDVGGDYPDVVHVLRMLNGDPVLDILMNAKQLADALQGMDCDYGDAVVIRLRADNMPVEVFGANDDQPVYALIMPYYKDKTASPELWRPAKSVDPEPQPEPESDAFEEV